MATQHALQPVFDQGVENALARKKLPRVLLDPQPRSHLQRQRQKGGGRVGTGLQVQVVPQIAVRQVLRALGFDDVGVVAVGLQKDPFQGVQFGQVRNRLARVGVR